MQVMGRYTGKVQLGTEVHQDKAKVRSCLQKSKSYNSPSEKRRISLGVEGKSTPSKNHLKESLRFTKLHLNKPQGVNIRYKNNNNGKMLISSSAKKVTDVANATVA